jgi:DnaJ-class molecular chaperone
MTQKTVHSSSCSYCEGAGYVDLLLGGSETCYACEGTGKEEGTENLGKTVVRKF